MYLSNETASSNSNLMDIVLSVIVAYWGSYNFFVFIANQYFVVVQIVITICTIAALVVYFERLPRYSLAVVFGAVAIYLASLLNNELDDYLFEGFMPLIVAGGLSALLLPVIQRKERLVAVWFCFQTLFCLASMRNYLLADSEQAGGAGMYMVLSQYLYNFNLLVMVTPFITKVIKPVVSITILVLTFTLQTYLGARGYLISTIVAVGLSALLFSTREHRKTVIATATLMLGMVLLAVIVAGTSVGQDAIEQISTEAGVNTRLYGMLIKGELSDTSGRDLLYSKVWQAIEENPIFGYGLCGDRPFADNGYAHNIFLEIGASLGLVGVAIFICYLGISINLLYKSENSAAKAIAFYYVASFVLPRFTSGTIIDPITLPAIVVIIHLYYQRTGCKTISTGVHAAFKAHIENDRK